MALTPEQIEEARKHFEAEKEAARKAKAKGKGQEPDDDADEDEEEEDQDDPKLEFTPQQKAYVEKLRKENAKTRVKAKELEDDHKKLNERVSKFEGGLKNLFKEEGDDKLTSEERIAKLEERERKKEEAAAHLELTNAVKSAALEHGVGKADFEYFEYLVSKKLGALGEDEELSDDDLEKIAKQAKAKSAPKSTSVDGKNPDPDEEDGEITIEQFQEMGIGARSALYQKDKALYERLVVAEKQAKKKK